MKKILKIHFFNGIYNHYSETGQKWFEPPCGMMRVNMAFNTTIEDYTKHATTNKKKVTCLTCKRILRKKENTKNA